MLRHQHKWESYVQECREKGYEGKVQKMCFPCKWKLRLISNIITDQEYWNSPKAKIHLQSRPVP